MEENMSGDDVPESQTSYANKPPEERRWCQSRVPISLRPVRLIQLVRKMINYSYDNEILIIDIMLLSLTIFIWIRLGNPLGTVTSIILVMMFATFTIIMGIDTIGQIGGFLTPDLPIFLVDLFGLILFMLAAQVVYYFFLYRRSRNDAVLALIILCLIGALLFLLDAMIMIMYWRYTYSKSKCLPCVPGKSLTLLYRKPAYDEYSEEAQSRFSKSYNPIAHDVSTCVSRDNTRSCHSGNLVTRRSSNRIGVGPRREYVDCPTDPESNGYVKSAETQTEDVESAELTDHETLATAAVEEKPAQTLQPCPVCSAALDYSPEGICPSVLAMIQSLRLFTSDSSQPANWKAPTLVERGTSPKSNSSFEATESTLVIAKKPPRVYETRPCPTHGAGLIAQKAGLPNPVTRTTLTHCIRKNKKCQTPLAKPIVVTDKCQNTETGQTEKGTNVEGSEKVNVAIQDERETLNGKRGTEEAEVQDEGIRLLGTLNEIKSEAPSRQRSSSSEVLSNVETTEESLDIVRNASQEVIVEEYDTVIGSAASPRLSEAPAEQESAIGKVDRGSTGSKRKSSVKPMPMNFITPRSSEKINIPQTQNTDVSASSIDQESQVPSSLEIKNDFVHSESTSQRNIFQRNNKVESIASICTSPFERLSSTSAKVNRPSGSPICLPESNRRNSDSRETMNSVFQSPCNYYKDVFGRYICRHCAHKHLIKIPQRCTAKPVGDIKCCSCSRTIFHRTPSDGQSKCKGCCKCRYAMYEDSKK